MNSGFVLRDHSDCWCDGQGMGVGFGKNKVLCSRNVKTATVSKRLGVVDAIYAMGRKDGGVACIKSMLLRRIGRAGT
ncbi:hypothetical protein ES702_00316 [subsurface metagenome]